MAHMKIRVNVAVTVQLGITFQQICHWNVSRVLDMATDIPFVATSVKGKVQYLRTQPYRKRKQLIRNGHYITSDISAGNFL